MKDRKPDTVSALAAAIPMPDTSDQLSELFAEHHRRVLAAAYRITGSMADAEDVAQTVFMRLGTGEGIPLKNAGSYLYRAAVNGALDLLRRRKVAAAEPLESALAWRRREPRPRRNAPSRPGNSPVSSGRRSASSAPRRGNVHLALHRRAGQSRDCGGDGNLAGGGGGHAPPDSIEAEETPSGVGTRAFERGKVMKRHEEELLNQAIEAVRGDEPDSEAIAASAARISDRLGIRMPALSAVEQIRSCEDVRKLLHAYREGALSEARTLLVKAHLGDCGACLRHFREGSKAAVVDWSAPAARIARDRHPRPARVFRPLLGWALAFSCALAVVRARLFTGPTGKFRRECAPRCSRLMARPS